MVSGSRCRLHMVRGGTMMRFETLWSVAYYVEAERFWQVTGEGSKQWALGRRAYLLGHAPGLAVRLRRRRVYAGWTPMAEATV